MNTYLPSTTPDYPYEKIIPNKGSNTPNHYRIALSLNPVDQFISAKVDLQLHAPHDGINHLRFYLHKQFIIQSVLESEEIDWWFDLKEPSPQAFIPYGRTLHVRLSRPLVKGEHTNFQFHYSGRITEIPEMSPNIVSEAWTELGLHLPWFPYNREYGVFTYDVEVQTAPNYQVGGCGEISSQEEQAWKLACETPVDDIVIVAAQNLVYQAPE